MKELYPPKVEKAVDALLTKHGACSPALRRSIEAYAAGLGGSTHEAEDLPEELVDYVRKVALYAYKTTDEDVTRLKKAGYSENEIFEITFCASMGADLARMERGLTLLKGGR